MVVARAVDARVVVLVRRAEAEAEAVGAEVYPRADLVELSLAAVPADVWAPHDGVAQLVLEANLDELVVRPVEFVAAHRGSVVGRGGVVPAAVVAPPVRGVVAELVREPVVPPQAAVGELVVLRVVLDAPGEHRFDRRSPPRPHAGHEHRVVLSVVGILRILHEAVGLVPRGVGRVVELDGAVDVEVEERAGDAALVGRAEHVPEAGRHAVPAVGKVPRASRELVEPVSARVEVVELVDSSAAVESGDVRLLRKHVEVRLHDVGHSVRGLGGAARGEGDASLDYRAPHGVPGGSCAAHRICARARIAPEGAPEAEARDDREDVGELHRQREAVVRVEAEGVVVGPEARRVAVRRVGALLAVLRVVAVEVSDPRLRLVVDGEREHGRWVPVEVELRKARDARVEVV